MSDIIIEARNLSKIYKLYNQPQDRLKEALHPLRKKYHSDFFALKNVSLEIQKGETIGIIGRNGAGKSTLLKIISGVLQPTSGDLDVNGKISSLLELGAGFNPELSGIENIYFNGSVIGFSKEEMDEKLDDILSFADIGDFIYQPVKSYSSGMFARLAFASAINIEPDILIVDEALSVGDARFQRKCFNRIDRLSDIGVTILFVSHDLDAVKNYTTRSYLMNKGEIIEEGKPKKIVLSYLQLLFGEIDQSIDLKNVESSIKLDKTINKKIFDKNKCNTTYGLGLADFEYVELEGLKELDLFEGGENIKINGDVNWNIKKILPIKELQQLIPNVIIGIHLTDVKGRILFGFNSYLYGMKINPLIQDHFPFQIDFQIPMLTSGDYFMTLGIAYGTHESHVMLCWYDDAILIKSVPNQKHTIGDMVLPYEFKQLVASK